MPDNKKTDYEIGYCKPPATTQFKKGQSGNPTGRPKGSLDIAAKLKAAFSARITVTEDGKRKKITKVDAMLKQLANKAAGGDTRAAKLAFEWMQKAKDPERFGQILQLKLTETEMKL